MQKGENGVNHSRFFQQRLPCKGSEKKIHPHGKNKYQNNKAVLVHIHIGQNHGKRIGQQKANQCTDKRQGDGKP